MRITLGKYVSQYFFAGSIFALALIIERVFQLPGIGLWFLAYLILRRVSFKLVFVLSIVADLATARLVGISGIIISFMLLMYSLSQTRKLYLWAGFFVALLIVTRLQFGQIPFGFWIGSLLSLPLYFVHFNFKGIKV